MKVKELIDLIKDYEDFEVDFCIGSMEDNTDYGFSVVSVKDICIDDVGHSSKILKLGYNDKLEGKLKIEY